MNNHRKHMAKHLLKPVTALTMALAVGASGLTLFTNSIGALAAEGTPVSGTKYTADFNSYAEEQAAANEFNIELAKESFVLMKNADNALPLSTEEKMVSLFGVRSDNHILGGSGSGSGSAAGVIGIPEALQSAGFVLNPRLLSIYAANNATAEASTDILKPAENSYEMYDGAAILVFSRTGSEFADANLWNVAGHSDPTDHTYSLDDNEKALVKYAKANFEKVIVLLNSSHPMEVGELDEEKTADNLGVDAILWVGNPGTTGMQALGLILNGSVNPSGHTVDVYPRDFTKDPTWPNFKGNIQGRIVSGYKLEQGEDGKWKYSVDEAGEKIPAAYIDNFYTPEQLNTEGFDKENVLAPASDGRNDFTSPAYLNGYARVTDGDGVNVVADGPNSGAQYYAVLDYEESIYMGYRWYETAYAEIKAGNYVPGGEEGEYAKIKDLTERADKWYADNVVYPFGYGLSYTDFEWKITNGDEIAKINLDGEVTVKMTVTNKGLTAGKDVGEIYFHAPYTKGQTEKSDVVLVEFAKSKLLAPGETQTLSVTFKAQDMASYDYLDSNNDGHTGYELDAGDYTIGVYSDSHTLLSSATFHIDTTKHYDTDSTTGAKIENLFTGDGEWDGTRSDLDWNESRRMPWMSADGESQMDLLTRADFEGTFPEAPDAGDLAFSDEAIQILSSEIYYTGFNDLPSDPWAKSKTDTEKGGEMEGWDQLAERADGTTAEILLKDMAGIDPKGTEPIVSSNTKLNGKTGKEAWTAFMNQLTWTEMVGLVSSTRFSTPALAAIGKDATTDADGPAQFSSGTFWVCEVNIACTWNTELAHKQGVYVGNESLLLGVNGWYGPGLNMHRNPAAGRNFEYYSQDGVQGGKIAAAVIGGAVSKGTKVYMKHLFLNDQETSRYTASTFITEQAIREIYIKAWEIAIKEGGANAYMRGFNRMALHANDSNYNLMVRLLENEFGFYAQSVSDMYGWNYNPGGSGDMGARIGGTPLGSWTATPGRNIEGTWDAAKKVVVLTYDDTITNGRDWTVNPADNSETNTSFSANNPGKLSEVNYGYSKAYKGATNLLTHEGLTEYKDGDTLESYTQWYAVRTTAQKMLYAAANSNCIKNGYDLSAFDTAMADKEVTVYAGYSGSTNLAVVLDGVNYTSYSAEGLPAGLTMSSAGVLSGATTAAIGTQARVTVTAMVDGWIKKTAQITVKVENPYTVTAPEGKVGTAYTGSISTEVITRSSSGSNFSSTSWAAEGLPAGLTMDEQGAISGTPTEAGTFTVEVTYTGTYRSGRNNRTESYTTSFELTITGEGSAQPAEVEFRIEGGKLQYKDGEDWKDVAGAAEAGKSVEKFEIKDGNLIVTYSDNTTADLGKVVGENGKDGAAGAKGEKGDKGDKGETGATGPAGPAGADGKDAEGGCGGVIGAGSAIIAAVTLLGAGAFVLRKKND